MSIIEVPEHLQKFKEPFEVTSFVENLVSQHVSKFKGIYEEDDISIKVKELLIEKNSDLKTYFSDIEAILRDSSESCHANQKSYLDGLELIKKTLNNSIDTLHSLSNTTQYIDRNIKGLGNNLIVHNTAITRSKDLLHLIDSFDLSLKVEDPFPIPNNHDEILKLFTTIQSLRQITHGIKGQHFSNACQRIAAAYKKMEGTIISELIKGYNEHNVSKMRQIIESVILSENLQPIYDALIAHCHKKSCDTENMFESQTHGFMEASNTFSKVLDVNYQIFINLYMQQLFEGPLKTFLNSRLNDVEPIVFVETLFLNVTQARRMELRIFSRNTGIERSTFEFYKNELFDLYIKKYIEKELNYLSNFYKKITNPVLSISDQEVISSNILQDVCVNMIQEAKTSQKRCELLSPPLQLAKNTSEIYEFIVQNFGFNFCIKLIDIYLKYVSNNEQKIEMNMDMFNFIDQITASVHMLDKYYTQLVLPQISSLPEYESVSSLLKKLMVLFENKLDLCLDRFLNICLNHMRNKISTDNANKKLLYTGSTTSQSQDIFDACTFLKKFNQQLVANISENNSHRIGLEWAVRFTRWILQYYKDFTFSVEGAIVALMDVKEFKSSFSVFNVKEIDNIFDLIYALFNVLIVSPNDVKNYCQTQEFVIKNVDPQLIQVYVENRLDFKESKIGRVV